MPMVASASVFAPVRSICFGCCLENWKSVSYFQDMIDRWNLSAPYGFYRAVLQ